jgi:hypothetical protein
MNRRLLSALVFLTVCLLLIGCGLFDNWKTFNGQGFTVKLPELPTIKIAQVSIPNGGIPVLAKYSLDVANPKCTVDIFSFDAWPATFDIPGIAPKVLLAAFLENQGNRSTKDLTTKNGFTGQEHATNDKKAVIRFYFNKPAVRVVVIESKTTALDPNFTNKMFESFSPAQLQTK